MNQTRLEKLRQEADKVGAKGNYFDAVNDILRWPHLKKEVLDDLERAIEAHKDERIKDMKRDEAWVWLFITARCPHCGIFGKKRILASSGVLCTDCGQFIYTY